MFLILAALLAVAIAGTHGPTALPASAPSDKFSATRAIVVLDSILVGNAPHPIGTAAHDLVRDRIIAELRRLGYQVVGFDISHEACVQARARDPGLGVAVADVRTLGVKTGSVDAVLSLGVVEHDERGPLPALAEACRVLKPGGLLILSVPYDNLLRRLVVNRVQGWVTRRRRRAGMKLGFVEYRFTEAEVRSFLERSGFAVVSSHPNDY